MRGKSLKLGVWNIHGYKTKDYIKFKDPAFVNKLTDKDIFCIIETHCQLKDCLKLSEYHPFHLIRPKSIKCNKRSGGLSIYIKKSLKPGVKILKQKSVDFQWLLLDKQFFGLNKDIFLCFVYNPPPDSTYLMKLNIDILSLIEEDVSKFSDHGDIILAGDFNARVGIEPDFICNDCEDPSTNFINYSPDITISSRNSEDKTILPRGRNLLELCIQSKLRILNGRKFGDTLGRYTSFQPQGCSVVDYFIVSECLMKKISLFHVHDYVGTMSDHCQISILLNVNYHVSPISNNCILKSLPLSYVWTEESACKFQNVLKSDRIQEKLRTFVKNDVNFSDTGINSLINDFNDILYDVADTSLKRKSQKINSNKKVTKKPKWQDHSLEELKKQLIDKEVLFKKYNKDPLVRGSYFSALKHYRKARRAKIRNHKQNVLDELDEIKDKNPKLYWELLNKFFREEDNQENCSENISAEEWLKYFKDLNSSKTNNNSNIDVLLELAENKKIFNELDNKITEKEVLHAIKSLKNKKACGLDKILNEMLKYGHSELIQPLSKIFNTILLSGFFPKIWCESIITPIHKAGDITDPNNYRGIAISSNIGKLFTKVLNNRLEEFLAKNKIIAEEQIGFTKGKRPTDHLFVLKSLIDQHTVKGSKPLYTCFVDFRRAFDTVDHLALFYKLCKIGISTSFYNVIKSLYLNNTLCIKIRDKLTSDFRSHVGVRQGDNLSPTLFKIFINDFKHKLDASCDPVQMADINVSCLLYADDLLLLSNSEKGLQNSLDKLSSYCDKWNLEVNIKKTKSLTFSVLGHVKNTKLYYKGSTLENTKFYKYLGVTFSSSGNFNEAKDIMYKKGVKAFFKYLKYFKNIKPGIETLMHIFDHTVKPVLLYGSEIWGSFDSKKLNKNNPDYHKFCVDLKPEKVHLKFCRFILGVNRHATNLAVYGELGRYPIMIDVLASMIKYFKRIKTSDNTLLNNAYQASKELAQKGYNSWMQNIYALLKFLNMTEEHILTLKGNLNKIIKKKLSIKFSETWKTKLFENKRKNKKHGNKLRTYRLFKDNYKFEKYLTILSQQQRNCFTKFRIGCHKLEIERGRYFNIDEDKRICKLCNTVVEDEIHFLLNCTTLSTVRAPIINSILTKYPNLKNLENKSLFIWLMSNENKNCMGQVCQLINSLNNVRNDLLG